MYILTRYVVWEVLKYFLAALVALTLIFTFGMGFKRGILEEGFPPLMMLQSMPFILPEMLGITIPVAMLYSVSSVFGRMTGANEMVALKSLGINPMAMVWPVLALAAFTSLGTIWMYEIAATWCRPQFRRMVCESIEEIAYSRLQKKLVLRRRNVLDHRQAESKNATAAESSYQPTITLRNQPGQHKITITAAEAEFRTNWKAETLEIICRNGEVDVDDGHFKAFVGEQLYSVPLPAPAWDHRHRDWAASRDIPGLIAGIQAEIAPLQKQLRSLESLRKASQALGLPASPDEAANERADRRQATPDLPPADRAIPPLGVRFHLPVLRADRHAGGHAVAPCRRADKLLRLFSAHLGGVLSVVDDRRRPLDLRRSCRRSRSGWAT